MTNKQKFTERRIWTICNSLLSCLQARSKLSTWLVNGSSMREGKTEMRPIFRHPNFQWDYKVPESLQPCVKIKRRRWRREFLFVFRARVALSLRHNSPLLLSVRFGTSLLISAPAATRDKPTSEASRISSKFCLFTSKLLWLAAAHCISKSQWNTHVGDLSKIVRGKTSCVRLEIQKKEWNQGIWEMGKNLCQFKNVSNISSDKQMRWGQIHWTRHMGTQM